MAQRYKVTKKKHYINNQIFEPGAIVSLPEGVEPGKLLVPVDAKGKEIEVAAPAKADDKPAAKPGK